MVGVGGLNKRVGFGTFFKGSTFKRLAALRQPEIPGQASQG